MDWKQLGIEPTKDKKEITRAYRTRLVDVNPEDKPEEFKRLREAYEEALRLAAQEEAPQEEKGPVELWADRLAALFADLRQRLCPDSWKELLSDDVCMGLDTRPLAPLSSATPSFLSAAGRLCTPPTTTRAGWT